MDNKQMLAIQETEQEEDYTQHVTTEGIVVKLCAVSHVQVSEISQIVEKEYREAGMPVDPPTYTVEVAGGGTRTEEHDETTLEYPLELALQETEDDADKAREIVKGRTAEAVKAWTEHQSCLAEMERESEIRKRNYLIKRGVKSWDDSTEIPQEWVEECKEDGFAVPESGAELRFYWIMRGLLKTAVDQAEVMFKVMVLTAQGIQTTKIKGALQFFRNQMAGLDPARKLEDAIAQEVLDDEPESVNS